ncbi:MAG: hypothetical protein ACYC3L_02235 [Gemmatimonadaceae bacterium]
MGRRLAFDSANGRFWVICPSCRRWNLSPSEERWDAIDECERLFERTRLRMSTDNIGLARIAEGTELVRVGTAMRPEMAAWRFGAQLAARRRKYMLTVTGGVILTVGLYVGTKTAGFGFVAGNWAWNLVKGGYERATRLVLPMPTTEGRKRAVTRNSAGVIVDASGLLDAPPRIETRHARDAKLSLGGDEGSTLGLVVPVVGGINARYYDAEVRGVAPKLLARINRSGGKKEQERLAVEMLERVANDRAPDLFTGLMHQYAAKTSATKLLKDFGEPLNLALEMALQEQRERELLAGELLDLENAWREAEELARIADSLGSSAIDRALAALKSRVSG